MAERDRARAPLVSIALLAAAGVAVRAALLAAGGEVELQSDEGNYAYLALALERFGIYFDQHRYLWPPGYAWWLAQCIGAFGERGLDTARWLQVGISAVEGAATMLIAHEVFGPRAARFAGALWAVYLPLAAFSFLLWPETPFLACFLPAVYLTLRIARAGPGEGTALRLAAVGALLAAAAHLKEVALPLALPWLVFLAWRAPAWREGLRRASATGLVLLACVLPWSLRNLEVYGRWTWLGATFGENAYQGLNAEYRNFDLVAIEVERFRGGDLPFDSEPRAGFTSVDAAAWPRADETLNTVDRLRENGRRGLAFARAHPGWLARSRVQKLADLAAPLSFYVRHVALGHYDGTWLGSRAGRWIACGWAAASVGLVSILALLGFATSLQDRSARWLIGGAILAFAATSTVVAMSRFRAPIEPLLIVLAAGFLACGPRHRGALAVAGAALGVASLAALWWIGWPATSAVLGEALGGGGS